MKRITLEEIENQYKIEHYLKLYEQIMLLIQSKKIKPVYASGKNGKKPALYKEYWRLEEQEDNSQYMDELSYFFVSDIETTYYLNHIKQYKEDRKWLLLLNQYLKTNRKSLEIPKSMNERSFEIWQREKFLKEEQGKKILKRCGIAIEKLNIYETTEPLAYYTATKKVPQNILILENKDTFFSMRRRLISGANTILGVEIGTLVYGAGKGIIRSFQDFSLCAEPYMRERDNRIYYLGDIDYEGIRIYECLVRVFESECVIEPFMEGYVKMLQRAQKIGINQLPDMKAGQNSNIDDIFRRYFKEQEFLYILDILEQSKYIPQEILSIEDFADGKVTV
ncbi:MAG: hypothetical protein IJO85_06825 [Lachnospiraceae bacterium]|nr:hypothetical protein [Lachnospiraceae bacterium]